MANEFVARKGIKSLGVISGSGDLHITGNGLVAGNLTVGGTIVAQEFKAELISSSIIYESGSTKFGDSIDDTHFRTGSYFISGSQFNITSSVNINGNLNVTGTSNFTVERANAIKTQEASDNNFYRITFTDFSDPTYNSIFTDGNSTNDLFYNPSTNTLRVGTLSASGDIRAGNGLIYIGNDGSVIENDGGNLSISHPIEITIGAPIVSLSNLSAGNITGSIISASGAVIADSFTGSTLTTTGNVKLGDATTDIHTVTGSLNISGSTTVNGGLSATSLTGSISSSNITGVLPVGSGGTGASTFTNNAVLTGNGTSAIVAESFLSFDGSTLSTVNISAAGNATLGNQITDAHTITGSLSLSGSIVGDVTIAKVGGPTLTLNSSTSGNSTLVLAPNSTGGTGGIINVNHASLPLILQTNSVQRVRVDANGTSVTGSLNVSGSVNILQSNYGAQISSSIANGVNAVVASLATGSYNGVYFDYTIGLGSAGRRVGTVMATWLPGSTTVEYTDFSTLDIGAAVGSVTMAADIATGNIRLRADNQSGSPIDVRSITRAI